MFTVKNNFNGRTKEAYEMGEKAFKAAHAWVSNVADVWKQIEKDYVSKYGKPEKSGKSSAEKSK